MSIILMLEDDHERIARFKSILIRTGKGWSMVVHRTAPDFMLAHSQLLKSPCLIALDHDLFTDGEGDPDPGDGRDVATYLAGCTPVCPVLIHSSNAPAADSMLFTLRDAGWSVSRIAPLGEDWVEAYWYPVACELISPQ